MFEGGGGLIIRVILVIQVSAETTGTSVSDHPAHTCSLCNPRDELVSDGRADHSHYSDLLWPSSGSTLLAHQAVNVISTWLTRYEHTCHTDWYCTHWGSCAGPGLGTWAEYPSTAKWFSSLRPPLSLCLSLCLSLSLSCLAYFLHWSSPPDYPQLCPLRSLATPPQTKSRSCLSPTERMLSRNK